MDRATLSICRADWTRLLTTFGCTEGKCEQPFVDLCRCYGESARRYHTLDHIHSVVETARMLGDGGELPPLFLAIWFHDAIYDSRAKDNEEKSAVYARIALLPLGVPDAIVRETERLILLTKSHAPTAGDRAGAILVGADLAVLGAPPAEYDAYALAIRQEYGWVSEAAYRDGRREVLELFLRRPRIYTSEEMFALREAAARRNLEREIAALA